MPPAGHAAHASARAPDSPAPLVHEFSRKLAALRHRPETTAAHQGGDDQPRLVDELVDELSELDRVGLQLTTGTGIEDVDVIEMVRQALTTISDTDNVTIVSEPPPAPARLGTAIDLTQQAIALAYVSRLLQGLSGVGLAAELSGTGTRLQLVVPAVARRTSVMRAGDREVAIRVVLASQREAFVEGLRLALHAHDDLEIVGVATDRGQLGRMVAERQPDVLLFDLQQPADLALVIADCRALSPSSKVLVLVPDEHAATFERIVAADADGVVTRDDSVDTVAAVIRGAKPAQGRPSPPPSAWWPPSSGDPGVDLMISTLSPRERGVLALLVAGHSNPWIARELHLSVNTIRKHVERILVKLGVHSKLEAAAFAARYGLAVAWDKRLL